jgi:hypothetical protein
LLYFENEIERQIAMKVSVLNKKTT